MDKTHLLNKKIYLCVITYTSIVNFRNIYPLFTLYICHLFTLHVNKWQLIYNIK